MSIRSTSLFFLSYLTIAFNSIFSEPRTKRHHLESSKLKRTPKSNQKSIQTSTSDLNEESRHSLTNRLDTNRNTISTRKLIVKKYCKKVQQNENDCQCRTCNCCGKNIQNSENKENIPSGTPRRNAKKAISYTVLFDKAPGRGDQKYHIKQQTVKKSFCKTIYFAAKSPKATPVLNFKPLEANQCPSLQVSDWKFQFYNRKFFTIVCVFKGVFTEE